MAKKSPLEIMNLMGKAAHEKQMKHEKMKEGSPEEEASESKEEAQAEGDSPAYSKGAQKAIGAKMHKMKDEDRPQDQKVAIAMSEARKKGLKVPPPKK